MKLDTRLIHAGAGDHAAHGGAVVTPIYQSSTFLSGGAHDSYEEVRYIRLNNTPNHVVLHKRLAALEGAEAALTFTSGMAAISCVLLTLLGKDDHILALDCLYGGTLALMREELPHLGIEVSFIDPHAPETWEDALQPNTRAIWAEPMTNPLLQVPRLDALSAFAQTHALTSVLDNTFLSPVNYRPIEDGFDVVVHSATKYLNGHSDIVAGSVAGDEAFIGQLVRRSGHLGGTLDPHAAFLLERGLKTLALRVRHQNASALALARALDAHARIEQVHYAGLPTHEGHEDAARLFEGCGGVLSFELTEATASDIERMLAHLTLAAHAPSLGGPETLITLPARTSHASISKEERAAIGVTDTLVRVSVGLEAPEDLIADMCGALDALDAE